MLLRVLETVFPVRHGERRLALALFLHSLFAVGAFITGRSVRDTLFLAHGPRGTLAWMYVASAIAVTLVGLLYAPLAQRMRRDRIALTSALMFALAFVGLWFMERSQAAWVYVALYVYVEVMGAIALVQFWTLANELFNAREAKRLYGLIGSGGTIANIVIGYAGARVASSFGASALLWLCVLLLVGTAFSSYAAGRLGRQRMFAKAVHKSPRSARTGSGAARVLASGHLRTVALLAGVTFFTTTLVDYQFKVIAASAYPKDQLAEFFGYFNVAIGMLALGLQLFGTGRLLNRAGVVGSLAVLPASLGLGTLALALFPMLWAASLAKGADTLFRYSVNDATTQILYLPIPGQGRASAKAFIDGVIKPLAIGTSGVSLAVYKATTAGDPYRLAYVTFGLCCAWGFIVFRMRAHYIRSLQDNLRARRLDLESARYRVLDGSTNSVLVRALESPDEREVANALELLPHLENVQLDNRVERLLDHPSAGIRVASLEYYARRQTMRFANSVYRKFEDGDPQVRAAAIDAFCAMGRDKAVRSVRPYLADPDPGIRGAAMTGMIRYGGLDGVLAAAEALKDLISHPDQAMRGRAARVLGNIGVRNFYQPVLQLMNDPEPTVRCEAIRAAGVLRAPEFVIPLIYKTQSTGALRDAVEALSAFGPSILGTLAKVLANRMEEPSIRRAVARVLGRLETVEAVEIVTQCLDEPDEELRTRLYRSLARLVKGGRLALPDHRAVRSALDQEFARAYQALADAELLGLHRLPNPSTPRRGLGAAEALLASALAEKVTQTERRIFLLLAVLFPGAEMEHIHAGIHDASAVDAPRRRANAVELLDNLLDRSLKQRFLPLLEDLPNTERLKLGAQVVVLSPRTREEAVKALCRDETAWVRSCALWYATELEGMPAVELAQVALLDASPVVRETALLSLAKRSPDEAARVAAQQVTDEAPVVRRQAALIATRRAIAG